MYPLRSIRSLQWLGTLAVLYAVCVSTQSQAADNSPDDARTIAQHRQWIEEMKTASRGPFQRIRWFCADGTVLPPRPYGCEPHGGGIQHGELTARAKTLRDSGYEVANVLAEIKADDFLSRPNLADRLGQILIEQFLIQIDDGWILRKARYYRGALQEEDERRGGRELLLALLADDKRLDRDFTLLRSAVSFLPHGADSRSAARIRQLSASLADRDTAFLTIKNKIHVKPELDDAETVRRYARTVADNSLRAGYTELAAIIDKVYGPSSALQAVDGFHKAASRRGQLPPRLAQALKSFTAQMTAPDRFRSLGMLLGALRQELPGIRGGALRLAAMDLSLQLEAEMFAEGSRLRTNLSKQNRAWRLARLAETTAGIYAAGLISPRQLAALEQSLARLSGTTVELSTYKRELDYLALVPGWALQRVQFHFGDAVQRLTQLEPKAQRFVEDSLRSSVLFIYAELLDGLLRDANHLAGVRNLLFEEDIGAGMRALNPGLAVGRLLPAPEPGGRYEEDGIYILPETAADLPPVTGILTAGEGNPLSHVQLLARNLGIPNVGVDERLLPRLLAMHGRRVILAVSALGSVQLIEDRGQSATLFPKRSAAEDQTLIVPDLNKLDLEQQTLTKLSALRAGDSGRTVGPKAAKLGELKQQFPQTVAEGLAIPFGAFKQLLERPYRSTSGGDPADGQPVLTWMRDEYRRLAQLQPGSTQRREQTEQFRKTLYEWALAQRPTPAFTNSLRTAMEAVFGPDGSYGVFVRSDTNVEDLPGFTGAGLNLTVPNVVGVDKVLQAIPRVWASPFTERAFAWRQAHMSQPEHVYPAILLLRSVPAQKSGVMVTRDIDTGADGWLSVAANEGVGGAVDGQRAESLRIHMASAEVRLLAQATATFRRRVNPSGGIDKIAASGNDYVLQPDEITQLIELARVLPERFPSIVDAQGNAAPADIEFGFLDGKLQLFQIRPFLENKQAQGNAYLNALDSTLNDMNTLSVNLSETPR